MIASNKTSNQTCSVEQHKIQKEMREMSKGIGATDLEQARRILAMSPEERKAVEARMKQMSPFGPFPVPASAPTQPTKPAQHDNADFSTDAEMMRRGMAMDRDELLELTKHKARFGGAFGISEPTNKIQGVGPLKASDFSADMLQATTIMNQLKAIAKSGKKITPEMVHPNGYPAFLGLR